MNEAPQKLLDYEQTRADTNLRRIEKYCTTTSKNIESDRLDFIEQEVARIHEKLSLTTISDEFLNTFSQSEQYRHIARYLQKVRTHCTNWLSAAPSSSEAVAYFKTLLSIREQEASRVITIAQILSPEQLKSITTIQNKLERTGKLNEAQSTQLNALVTQIRDRIENPLTLVPFFIQLATNTTNTPTELENFTGSGFKSLEEYIRITRGLEALNAQTSIQPAEKRYARARFAWQLARTYNYPTAWAVDIAEGKQIFSTTYVSQVILELFNGTESPLSERRHKKSHRAVLIRKVQQAVAVAIVGSTLVSGIAYRDTVTKGIVDATEQTISFLASIDDDAGYSFEKPDQPPEDFAESFSSLFESLQNTDFVEPERNTDPFDLQSLEPSEEITSQETTDSPPTPLPPETRVEDVQQNIPAPITPDEMEWSTSTSGTSNAVGPEGSTTPEQLREQYTHIAWVIESARNIPHYLGEVLLTQFDPQTGVFSRETIAPESLHWQTVEYKTIEDSQLHMRARFTTLADTFLIPVAHNFALDTARIMIVRSNGTTESVAVEQARSTDGAQYIRPTTRPNPLRAGEYVEVSIGQSVGSPQSISTEMLRDPEQGDVSIAVLPQEVQDLIHALNADTLSTEREKLEKLRAWYSDNFTYSVDPKLDWYIHSGNPTLEQLLGRVYGTGSSTTDPYYDPALSLELKGICGTVNSYFAMAAGHLNLEGFVVLESGFLTDSTNVSGENSYLTGGQSHAWAAYIGPNGDTYILDATPYTLDAFTKEVLESLDLSSLSQAGIEPAIVDRQRIVETISHSALVETEAPEVPFSVFADAKNLFEPELKPGMWHISGTGYGVEVLDAGITIPFATKLSPAGNFVYDLERFPLSQIYPSPNINFPKTNEEIKTYTVEAQGIQLKKPGLWLPVPASSVIDPESIRIYRYTPSEPSKKTPVAVQGLYTSAEAQEAPFMVLSLSPEEVSQYTFDISYTSKTAYVKEFLTAASIASFQEYFQPWVDRTVFDTRLQELLRLLEGNPSVLDLKNAGFESSFIAGVKLGDEYVIQSDEIKAHVLFFYLRDTFTIDLDPSQKWDRVYAAGNPSFPEKLRRISSFRRVDPTTFITYFASALSTLPSSNGLYASIPFVIQHINQPGWYLEGLSGVNQNYSNNNTSFFDTLFPQVVLLQSYSEFLSGTDFKTLDPKEAIEQFTTSTLDADSYDTSFSPQYLIAPYYIGSERLTPQYDTVSASYAQDITALIYRDFSKRFVTDASGKTLYQHPEAYAYEVRRDTLTHIETFLNTRASATEVTLSKMKTLFEVDFYRWLYERGLQGAALETGLAAVLGLLMGGWVSSKVKWMRGFSADMAKQLLADFEAQVGNGDPQVIRTLRKFFAEIYSPYKKFGGENIFNFPVSLFTAGRLQLFMQQAETLMNSNTSTPFSEHSPNAVVKKLYKNAQFVLLQRGMSDVNAQFAARFASEFLHMPIRHILFLRKALAEYPQFVELQSEHMGFKKVLPMITILKDMIKLRGEHLGLTTANLEPTKKVETTTKLIESILPRLQHHIESSEGREYGSTEQHFAQLMAQNFVSQVIIPYLEIYFAEQSEHARREK